MMTDDRRIDRMSGCACMGKLMLGTVGLVILGLFCVTDLQRCLMSDGPRNGPLVKTMVILKDLRIATEAFHAEYHRYPVIPSSSANIDHYLRSRGQMLGELSSFKEAILNFKKIKFIDLPAAREGKYGIWQNGEEWVLSDLWGEPYYIALDTNEDNMIANPEFGADQSDHEYAQRCKNSPPPPTLPTRVLIYSSGPDRDPNTWHDNICSWRN
jgi:hypothetical protein